MESLGCFSAAPGGDYTAPGGNFCLENEPFFPPNAKYNAEECSRKVVESSQVLESSLCAKSLSVESSWSKESSLQCQKDVDGCSMESSQFVKPVMESSGMLESMESSFKPGFPIKMQFNHSLESSLLAWKQSAVDLKLSMESSSNVSVQGINELRGTRNLKMYRGKLRRRPAAMTRNDGCVESSPALKSVSGTGSGPHQAMSTLDGRLPQGLNAAENIAVLQNCALKPTSNL